MAIKNIEICGIRSFKNKISVEFAIPNNTDEGSGLNILVGPNNSGKSSLIESIYLVNNTATNIPNSMRNKQSENGVYIKVTQADGTIKEVYNNIESPAFLKTKYFNDKGEEINRQNNNPIAYILSSKRNIPSFFNNNSFSRENFLYTIGGYNYRNNDIFNNIGGRFQHIVESHKELFDLELNMILGYIPNWYVDLDDSNNLYIAFKDGNTINTNSGAGDGFINIFIMLTAIYDAPPGSTIIIDEPEVALHPDIQSRLMERLIYHSKDKQIIISTHSPYFINLKSLQFGAKLLRFIKENEATNIYYIKQSNISKIKSLFNSAEQPYLNDIKSNEIFFRDKLILVEGVDDVYGYDKLFQNYDYKTTGTFYGWGAGGAEKIPILLSLLNDLGYKKIVVLLDSDKPELYNDLSSKYEKYKIIIISAKDIRNKPAPYLTKIKYVIDELKSQSTEKELDILNNFLEKYTSNYEIKGFIKKRDPLQINDEYKDNILSIISEISEYFDDYDYAKEEQDSHSKITEAINNENIAKQIVDNYIEKNSNKYTDHIKNKYSNHVFETTGGGAPELIKYENNLYTYEFKIGAETASFELVEYKVILQIDVSTNSIVNIKYDETTNTLSTP